MALVSANGKAWRLRRVYHIRVHGVCAVCTFYGIFRPYILNQCADCFLPASERAIAIQFLGASRYPYSL